MGKLGGHGARQEIGGEVQKPEEKQRSQGWRDRALQRKAGEVEIFDAAGD